MMVVNAVFQKVGPISAVGRFDFSGQMSWVILSTFLPIVDHHSRGFFFEYMCVCLPLSFHFKQVEAYPLKVNSPTLNHQVVYQSVCIFSNHQRVSNLRLHLKPISGQIIATSHDLTPNGGLDREITLFKGNLGW